MHNLFPNKFASTTSRVTERLIFFYRIYLLQCDDVEKCSPHVNSGYRLRSGQKVILHNCQIKMIIKSASQSILDVSTRKRLNGLVGACLLIVRSVHQSNDRKL